MGIPRFYRYMSERYPLINQPISDVSLLPEFDAFYLDMNGIIHNCTHSDAADDALNTQSLNAQLHSIFTYMDRLITHIIKPKQLVYFAIDGVAPRAKLNQQRSRRFRAGLDRQEAMEKERHLQIKLEDEKNGHTAAPVADKFDSNCITPGTSFLSELSQHLVYFVRHKMKTDPLWSRLEVFFSGSEVPGEGEHKIVEFIRHRKMLPGYGSDVRHCMYGSDADLMLLGLMTHEPHFTLVREVVVWGSHHASKVQAKQIQEQQWQLVHLSLFREYLTMEMRVLPPFDGERMLDDFILLTFLLGNDFIPHSPTLEISEDAIPLLLQVYRALLERHNGQYLTENGQLINLPLLQELFDVIGSKEEDILVDRAIEESKKKHRGHRQPKPSVSHDVDENAVQNAVMALRGDDEDQPPPLLDDDEDEQALMEALDGEFETKVALAAEAEEHAIFAALAGSENFQDTKWTYYERKFGISRGNGHAGNHDLAKVKKHYMESLMWVLAYYFQGPPSWSWYYPYHYAPMISDLTNIEEIVAQIKFDNDPATDGPLLPFEQLMANLPASSAHLVPEPYRFLMVSPLSPIKHFYPEKFEIDMEGKRNPWEGVNILPFIDGALLKAAIAQYCPSSRLTKAERERNELKMEPLRIVYDASATDTLRSTLPGIQGFPDVPNCNTRVTDFILPKIETYGGKFQSKLMDGVQLPLAGFPSLYTLPLEAVRIDKVGLNCFGMRSRKATLILQLPPPSDPSTESVPSVSAATMTPEQLLGQIVLANWPNLHEARVVGVSTLSGEHRLDTNSQHRSKSQAPSIVFTPYDGDQKTTWAHFAQTEVVKLLSGAGTPGSGGIDLGKKGITTVLHVLPLQGMVSNPVTGAVEKKFGDDEAVVPAQLAVVNRQLYDERFQETEQLPLVERFPTESVALITKGNWLGCTAVVKGYDEEDYSVRVQVNTIDREPPFGYVIAQQITDKFLPGFIVAKKLGVSTTTLGLITGSVFVKPGDHEIGLNLRFRKDLLLPGYSRLVDRNASGNNPASKADADAENVWRKGDIVQIMGSNVLKNADTTQQQRQGSPSPNAGGGNTTWEYTERALQLLLAYKHEFPEVLARLEKAGFATSYRGSDVLGVSDPSQIEVKAGAIKLWIEQQKIASKEQSKHIPVTSEYMCLNAIRAVEAAGTLRAKEREKVAERNPTEVNVAAYELFRPNPLVNQDLTGREVSQSASKNPGPPRLGDRIINISARGVPFGHRGTVVATHVSSKCVEVLFDESFTGGEPLYGTTSRDRGKIVPWNNVLCVSTPTSGLPQRQQHQQQRGSAPSNRVIIDRSGNNNRSRGQQSPGSVQISNNRRSGKQAPAAPPAPPSIPSTLPPPPNADKIKMLITKWSGNGEAPSTQGNESAIPVPQVEKENVAKNESIKTAVAPSVAAFFSAAQASAETPELAAKAVEPSVAAFFSAAQASGPAEVPLPTADPVLNLFPHNYSNGGNNGLFVPPQPPLPPPQAAYPNLMVPGAYPPPPPQAYYPQPGYMGYPPQHAAPLPPTNYPAPPSKLSVTANEFEYPPLSAAKGPKKAAQPVAPEPKVAPAKKTTPRSKGKNKAPRDANASSDSTQQRWVPKSEGASTGKPQLLMPSQLVRHQQQKQAPPQ